MSSRHHLHRLWRGLASAFWFLLVVFLGSALLVWLLSDAPSDFVRFLLK